MEKLKIGAEKLGLHLNPRQLEQFSIYYQGLIDWNKRMNLTAITDYEEVQVKHFLDALTVTLAAGDSFSTSNNPRIIDIGTGAGMPGLPLKIVFPEIKLILLDATAKKASFLHHLNQRLGLNDVEIVVGRAEEIAHRKEYREGFEVVLSRAVAPLPTLVELTLPFCAISGRFIAQKKGNIDQEISQAIRAINLMGGKLREVKRIELEGLSDERQLVIIDKVLLTPEQYPRRPGMPTKRPLI